MAFMFETRLPQRVTKFAAGLAGLQKDYIECWSGLKRRFDPKKRDAW
jgi:homogentisate 1,2-dioxygenase